MQKDKTNGNIKYYFIVRPKSDIQNANSKDEVVFGGITRWTLDMGGGCIIKTKCPICKSENCIREFHSIGFERIFCKGCGYEITFWCTRDKYFNPIPFDKSKDLTLEYITSKEFIKINPYGIYVMELFNGGICGAAFETNLNFSPSQNQNPNVRKITVFKIINDKVVNKVVFQSPYHLSLGQCQIDNA